MPSAYVLINVETGAEDKVLNELRRLEVLETIYVSYGVYDLIVRLRANTMDELKEIVTRKIRATSQVLSTLTLIITEEKAK
jgi:DNA-binding Lrp family transcriptional regulator